MTILLAAIATAQGAYAKNVLPVLPESIQLRQGYYRIPGLGILVNNDTPIIPNGHFTWGEATRDGSRIPRDTWYRGELVKAETISQNIVELATELEKIRERFGNHPITINSWYRPPEVNNSTKGAAKDSVHVLGMAADIVVFRHGSYKVYSVLDGENWPGGLGRYINRTHIDIRHLIGMPAARWDG